MKHILFHQNPKDIYKVALLIKEPSFSQINLNKAYVKPLIKRGLPPDDIIALSLKYNEHNKAPASLIKSHLETVLKACVKLCVDTLLVADAAYFKTLTKERKAEPHHGYIKKCAIKGYEHLNVILSINYQVLFYNPVMQDKIDMSLDTVMGHLNGTHQDLGKGIIHNAVYPSQLEDIEALLNDLHKYHVITCDTETFSLNIVNAGLGTIAFAWCRHEGFAFAVDYDWLGNDVDGNPYVSTEGECAIRTEKPEIIALLKNFFETYEGKIIYHNGCFDIKILIYRLFMKDASDIKGLIHGLKLMYRDIDDTKIITYLATNTTAGNKLDLKSNAFEFAGNYAQEDIHNICLIPKPELLEYNLVDCLCTWYVYEKNHPIMIKDDQLNIYNKIMLPSMKVITHMELIGMPMNYMEIRNTEAKLNTILQAQRKIVADSQLVKDYEWKLQREAMIMKNLLLKKKIRPIEDFYEPFNPASNKQLRGLLYEQFGFEVIDKTDTGLAATGGKTVKKLLKKLMNEHNLTDEDLK